MAWEVLFNTEMILISGFHVFHINYYLRRLYSVAVVSSNLVRFRLILDFLVITLVSGLLISEVSQTETERVRARLHQASASMQSH